MLKALYVFAALTGWGLVFDLSMLSVGVATYENQYYQILRLRKESQAFSEAERVEKARVVWDRVAENYASKEFLSFREDTAFFWCTEGSWLSYLPMEFWVNRAVSSSVVCMTPENLHVEISAENQRIFSLFLADVKFSEFRWPTTESAGAYAEYQYDGMCWRLDDGVDAHLACLVRPLVRPWIGDKTKTLWYKHLQTSGLGRRTELRYEAWREDYGGASWIGVVRYGGELCDVLLFERNHIERWDVFLIDPRGFVMVRYMIHSFPDQPNDKWWVVLYYRDISVTPLLPAEFVPSEALMREAQTWQKVDARREVHIGQ